MTKILNHIKANPRFTFVSLVFLTGVCICIFAPRFHVFERLSKYVVQITIMYWLSGILFLMLHKFRYMILSFICSGALCLFLQIFITPSTMPRPSVTQEPVIKVGQFNLSDSKSSPSATIKMIQKLNADVISLQEVTPEWRQTVSDSLEKLYPYHCSLINADIYSFDIYSRYPFEHCDTILCINAPILALKFRNTYIGGQFFVISTYIAPPFYKAAAQIGKNQLDSISSYCARQKSPAIILGDYNLHTTSPLLQDFKVMANVDDSRHGYRIERNDGHISLFDAPTDYIFHTRHFNCISFSTVDGPSKEHLGIFGEYQINSDSIPHPTFKESEQLPTYGLKKKTK